MVSVLSYCALLERQTADEIVNGAINRDAELNNEIMGVKDFCERYLPEDINFRGRYTQAVKEAVVAKITAHSRNGLRTGNYLAVLNGILFCFLLGC
jgi:hypothetical protein